MSLPALTQENFDDFLAQDGRPVVIKFWAPWCGPCRAMAPAFEAAAGNHPQFRFAEVNLDEEPQLGARARVRALPTTQVWKDGGLAATHTGAMTARQLAQFLDDA